MTKDSIAIACPPYPQYEDAPKDQSHSELRECPKCKGQMWLSEKKKGYLAFNALLNKEIILGCYDCITKMVEENAALIKELVRVDL